MTKDSKIVQWVSHKLCPQVQRRLHKLAAAMDVKQIAVMPDVHLAGDVCNGVVVATESRLYPQCIGGDIGCGYLSVELAGPELGSLSRKLPEIWNRIRRAVPLNKHADRSAFASEIELSSEKLAKATQREGRLQLGTLGRGNHFVELQRDQQGTVALLIHSGSRSMGQTISTWHLGNASVDMHCGLKYLDANSGAGKAFLQDLQWARRYAAANRLEMLRAVERNALSSLGIALDQSSTIHLDHNHVQAEIHGGKSLWVHRKGAQVLQSGQRSVIPGSMGTTTYLVEGRANEEAFGSCSHGSGRLMSRKEAAKNLSVKQMRRELRGVCYNETSARRLLDESPAAYKDIRQVMKAQKALVRIVGRREPLLNFKGP